MVSGGDGDGSGKRSAGGEGGKTGEGGEGGKTGEGGKGDGPGKGAGVTIDHAGMVVTSSNCSNASVTAALPLLIELATNLRCSRCCCLKRKLRRPYTVITTPRRRPATKLTTLCENIFSHPSER